MNPLALTSLTATSAIGRGLDETLASLRGQRSGLAPCRFETVTLDTCVGEVRGVDEVSLPQGLAGFECRNTRLAWLGLAQDGFAEAVAQCVARHGSVHLGAAGPPAVARPPVGRNNSIPALRLHADTHDAGPRAPAAQ